MKVLVTGGAGYIGSVTAKFLEDKGVDVVVFDNLSQGHRENVSSELIVGDLIKKEDFKQLEDKKFDAVIHFAANSLAGESMKKPYVYFYNNVVGALNLLEFMVKTDVKNIVFSSSCSIYGFPRTLPVTENSEKNPESVYGESKLMIEKILKWYDEIYGIKYVNLRYFNAAGATLDGKLGEDHDPETHIIPLAIKAAITRSEFSLFGNDYDTTDGTCVRDYIHVVDLAEAHFLAIEKIKKDNISDSYNLGAGKGYSNMEILQVVKKVSGEDFKIKICPRRPGDPPKIFADYQKAKQDLGFEPKYSDLETIINSSWQWHKRSGK